MPKCGLGEEVRPGLGLLGEQTHLWRGVLQVGFSSRAVPLEIEHNEGHCDEVTVPLSSAVAVSRNRSS